MLFSAEKKRGCPHTDPADINLIGDEFIGAAEIPTLFT